MIRLLATECVRDCSWMDQYRALLADSPHWAFEYTQEAVTTMAIYLPIKFLWRRWIKRHDEEHHGH